MEHIINSRKISLVQFSTEKDWQAELPSEDWLCIFIVNGTPRRYVDEGILKILNRNVSYVCTAGPESEKVHDLIDEELIYRDVGIENLHLPKHHIITTWHDDFDEGIWFGIFAAQHDELEIKNVAILDLTGGNKEMEIQQALRRMATKE